MRQFRAIRPYFANMSNECRATLGRQFRDICEYLTTFARISLSFACFVRTVMRLSNDIRATVVNLSHCRFATISRRNVRDSRTNVIRLLSKKLVANW